MRPPKKQASLSNVKAQTCVKSFDGETSQVQSDKFPILTNNLCNKPHNYKFGVRILTCPCKVPKVYKKPEGSNFDKPTQGGDILLQEFHLLGICLRPL